MRAGARCSRKSPPGSPPPPRSVLPGSLRNSASRTAEAGPGRAGVLATLQNGDNQEQCVSAVHIPASPRPPSPGLLGPDHGGLVCLVGPGAEAALKGFFPLKPVPLFGACPSLACAPLAACLSSCPCIPLGHVPLWPVQPSVLVFSGSCAPWGLDPLKLVHPSGT